MSRLLRVLSRTGLRRGFAEGSRGWMTIGVGATLLRLAARALANKPEVTYRTELRAGEALEIRTFKPKKQRGT